MAVPMKFYEESELDKSSNHPQQRKNRQKKKISSIARLYPLE